jgi:uncharacterized protein YcbK (DUF882 family)
VRLLLVALLLSSLPAFAARPSSAARPAHAPRKRPPPVEMTALNTHETFTLQPDAAGRFSARELHGWNRFLRCHHTGRVHQMATRLASLIYETSKHFQFGKILVVAGYRAPRIARQKGNPKSPHKRGLACDFRIEGVANTELRDYLRGAFGRVGIGYYPNSDFVHLDVRQKQSAFWIDYSGPGERARYSKSPEEDLRGEKPELEDEAAPEAVTQAPLPSKEPEGPQPQEGLEPGVTTPNLPALNPATP